MSAIHIKYQISITPTIPYHPIYISGEGRFAESAATEIEFEGIRYDVFARMLEYLYTGEAPELAVDSSSDIQADVNTAVDMLLLSDQFMLDHLKQICERMLANAVSPLTCAYLSRVADAANADQLKRVCDHYARNFDIKVQAQGDAGVDVDEKDETMGVL